MEIKGIWHMLQFAMSAVGGWLGLFLGGFDGFLYALVVFVVVDYLIGIMYACIDKNLSSEIGAKGISKKVLIFTLVGIGHTIDIYLVGDGSVVRSAVIFFFCSNEGVSILENASRLGLPIPQRLKDILSQIHNNEGKNKTGGSV